MGKNEGTDGAEIEYYIQEVVNCEIFKKQTQPGKKLSFKKPYWKPTQVSEY